MALHLQATVLHLQAMVLPVATEGFSSYPGIKKTKTKTKTRGTEVVMAEVEETCVTAMVLPLLAMGHPPMNLPHLMMHHLTMPQLTQLPLHHTVLPLHHTALLLHHIVLLLHRIVVLLLPHLVLLLLLYPPPHAPQCMKHSMYPVLRNSVL